MRRHPLRLAILFLPFMLLTVHRTQQADQPTRSALETGSKKKWEDLPANMKEWRRVPVALGKLPAKTPWRFVEGDVLIMSGGNVPEMLLYNKVQTNGILHYEWRTKKGPTAYGGGSYVRTSADGAVWHLAYAGSKSGATLTGNSLLDGKAIRLDPKKTQLAGPSRLKPPGEWNVSEVTAKDKTVSLWTNGYVVAEWALIDVAKGHIGFKAEGYPLEIKNLKYLKLR